MILDQLKFTESVTRGLELSDDKAVAYAAKIEEFLGLLEGRIDTAQAYEVLEILSCLVSFKAYFESVERWEGLVFRALEMIRQNIYNSAYHPLYGFFGIAHVAMVLKELCKEQPNLARFLQSVDKVLATNVQDYLKSSEEELMTSGNFECITGLSGVLRHALDSYEETLEEATIDIVKLFSRRAHDKAILGHTIPGWQYYPSATEKHYMTESAENGCINYGLSHGMAGALVMLARAYKEGIDLIGQETAIDGLFDEYMTSYYIADNVAQWPGRITVEDYLAMKSRGLPHKVPRQMSWCYGSIGILRAMYLAANYMNKADIKAFALDELVKIAQMDTERYLFKFANVCHGNASIVSIMDEMFRETGNVVFRNKTLEQSHILVDFIINANYSHVGETREDTVHLFSYLEGYSGILQTLQAVVDGGNGHKKQILVV